MAARDFRSITVPIILGSVTSAFAVEHNGTQSHRYSKKDFIERYEANFGPLPEGF